MPCITQYLSTLPIEINIKIWKLVYDESVYMIEKSKLVWLRKTMPIVTDSYQSIKIHGCYQRTVYDADMYLFTCLDTDKFDNVWSHIVEWDESMTNNIRTWVVDVNGQWYSCTSCEYYFEETMLDKKQPYLCNKTIRITDDDFEFHKKNSEQWWEDRLYWRECFQFSIDCIAPRSSRPIVQLWRLMD